MEKTPELNRKHLAVPLSRVLDIVEEKLIQDDERRVKNPFESVIEKESITIDDLRRIGKLPIEILLRHMDPRTLVLSTGQETAVRYDFDNTL